MPNKQKNPQPHKPKPQNLQKAVLNHQTYYSTYHSSLALGTGKAQDEESLAKQPASLWAVQSNFQEPTGWGHAHIPAAGQKNFTVRQLHLQLSAFQLPGAKLEPLEHTS